MMNFPKGKNKREENFLDGLRGIILIPEDWERYLDTYRKLGGVIARRQVRAEYDIKMINKKLKEHSKEV